MTQQEYNSKRQKCWEEYLRKQESEGKSSYSAFLASFDYAYTLGREKETISQEKVEKAAEESAINRHLVTGSMTAEVWQSGFMEGANYILGKQFGNSEQEDVEKAAEKHADELRVPSTIPGVIVPMLHDIAKSSYICGAQDTLGKQERDEDTVISGWAARHGNGPNVLGLRIYTVKPKRTELLKMWEGHREKFVLIDHRLFPDLTWECAPIEVELIIKRKKNG